MLYDTDFMASDYSQFDIFKKNSKELTREDIIRYVQARHIRMVNFMYTAEDGRLKTLNFVINDEDYLKTILTFGERVDGSSLFPSYVEAGNSDLYVMPRYETAFLDPFSEIDTLCFLCTFFDKNGDFFAAAPQRILHKAARTFKERCHMDFEAMAELEYYVIDEANGLYPATDQRGYHESAPYAKLNEFRKECMLILANLGASIKYGHSEVGNFSLNGKIYEQNEIEFLPCPVESAAEQVTLAKWVIRNLAYKYGLNVTFAPKITEGKAGSGMHIHMRIMKEGQNMLVNADGSLSDIAHKAIAGMMDLAASITAFGNRNPTSYLRLVPHQEAPTNICWGDRNRSVLLRVPLGWTNSGDMCVKANPQQEGTNISARNKQTIEMRSPDCSADIYLLLAGLCVACRHGLEMDAALDFAAKTYVDGDIHSAENKAKLDSLEQLPASCVASAQCLDKQRGEYERYEVFSKRAIDGIIAKLSSFQDDKLREKLSNKDYVLDLVEKYFHV